MFQHKPAAIHPLFKALLKKTPNEVEKMIDNGADVNMRTLDGSKTPLHVATHRGDIRMVQMLLRKKADVMAKTDAGFTPLHVAAQNNKVNIIKILVAAKAGVNATTNVGCTPLHESAANGCGDAVVELIGLGADLNAKDFRYNLTPANLAHQNGHVRLRDILCSHMSYQDSFIQNINYILFNWKRTFSMSTLEDKLIQQMIDNTKGINEADHLFNNLSAILKSQSFIIIPKQLTEMKRLLMENMKRYNEDKTMALKMKTEAQDSLATAAKGSAEVVNQLGSQNTVTSSTQAPVSQVQSNQPNAQPAFMPLLAALQASGSASNNSPLVSAPNAIDSKDKKAMG